MKLIEAMKKIKDLQRKAEDLRGKVGQHCAHLSHETPVYGDKQREQVKEWIQAHTDIVQEVCRLRTAVQRTNLATEVEIELDGVGPVKKTIAEWIHRRGNKEVTGLAKLDQEMWAKLGDRGLREGFAQDSQGQKIDVKIVRHFDPTERDKKLEMYRSEPMKIDSTLEIVNAVTEVIEEE